MIRSGHIQGLLGLGILIVGAVMLFGRAEVRWSGKFEHWGKRANEQRNFGGSASDLGGSNDLL